MYNIINEKEPTTNDWNMRGLNISKGQELGLFELGSTIVMIFEAENVQWKVVPGQ